MNMTLNQRLYAFIEYLGITVSAFERSVGVSNGFVKSAKEQVGANKLASILKTYPQLSPTWLVMGLGPMLIDNVNPTFQSSKFSKSSDLYSSSFIPVSEQLISSLVTELQKKDEQIERFIKLLEHIVYQGGNNDFQTLEISPKSRQNSEKTE